MIRSLALLFVFLSFIGLGFVAPFITTLGYVWVDTFRPQAVAYIILNQMPVALIMGRLPHSAAISCGPPVAAAAHCFTTLLTC